LNFSDKTAFKVLLLDGVIRLAANGALFWLIVHATMFPYSNPVNSAITPCTFYPGWFPNLLIVVIVFNIARFFVAFSWAVASLGVNISANSISAANDLTALFPRYVNIRRGQIICGIIGAWGLVPWKILSSALSFLNFMSAYAVFLGPIAAIMISDFWIVHHTRLDIIAMYHPHQRYRYTHGYNWRAITAFVIGVAPNLPGFIQTINPSINVGNAIHLFDIAWLLGFSLSFIVYTVINHFWPAAETKVDKAVLPDDIYSQETSSLSEGLQNEEKESIRSTTFVA